ncbi:DUF4942 domain-containing protein [uncultured Pleomorphomonas sp.]|uniref:DUF4942 domain-containing protein n=1 Tax=uncultured Pleomorphomonas sp. TaxID=442121 RepID=UPI0025874EA5|nr:DUF4942 domain-containing protein [uncultured Pleomorphomonas sp.]
METDVNALVPRPSIEQIVSFRDQAISRYEQAFEKIAEADAAVREAGALWEAASPGKSGEWSSSTDEIKNFLNAVRLPDRDQYLRTARRLIDVTVWAHVIDIAGIEPLMDSQAKQELRDQMRYIPERVDRHGELINQDEIDKTLPPVTVDNVMATLERFRADAELIFRRGIVNAFTKLDRRFRSHDGFKIGSRVIVNYLIRDGHIYSSSSRADMLTDIERTFLVLDGKTERAKYGRIVDELDRANPSSYFNRQAFEVESDYFKIRCFKNGNAHLWMTRKDLVKKVNLILADHYGEVIGDGMTKEDDPLSPDKAKTTPARYFGFFPTPKAAADELLSGARLLRSADQPPLRVLEPSAGTGNLARRCFCHLEDYPEYHRQRYGSEYRYDNKVDCIEIQPHLAMQLEAEGIYNRVTCGDFLQMRPDPANLYDVVVMNPPFDRERDIDHVVHALQFLKPDGYLTAIMSAGTEFRETRKAIAFREMMEKMHAKWSDLPAGSFAEVGTYVNTCIVRVYKDGRRTY